MSPVEHTALADALAANSTPALPTALKYLLDPTPETVALLGRDGGTGVGHSLRRTVASDLEGMLDAPSPVAFDADAPIMVMDTSAPIGASEQARSLAAARGATWLEAAVTNPNGAKRIVVYDEGWRVRSDPYMLAKMSEQWRLARTYGIANLMIMYKVADLNEIGDGSGGLRQKALGLLTEADTRIIYRQKYDATRLTKEALGLTEVECEHVENLPKGMGLWKVGNRSFIVANRSTTDEMAVFGTDEGMPRCGAVDIQPIRWHRALRRTDEVDRGSICSMHRHHRICLADRRPCARSPGNSFGGRIFPVACVADAR